jgi:hypothetical protein
MDAVTRILALWAVTYGLLKRELSNLADPCPWIHRNLPMSHSNRSDLASRKRERKTDLGLIAGVILDLPVRVRLMGLMVVKQALH